MLITSVPSYSLHQRTIRVTTSSSIATVRRAWITHFPGILSRSSPSHVPIRSLAKLTENNLDDGCKQSNILLKGTIPSNGTGIQIGQFTELHRTFSQRDVNSFGELSGDFNTVHFPADQQSHDDDFNDGQHGNKLFIQHESRPILHGILLSSLFSTIFGTLIPGCIYRSQTLKFYHPVYVNETACGRVLVTKLRQIDRSGGNSGGGVLCTCDTTITKAQMNSNANDELDNQNLLCVVGEAQVWLPGVSLLQKSTTSTEDV